VVKLDGMDVVGQFEISISFAHFRLTAKPDGHERDRSRSLAREATGRGVEVVDKVDRGWSRLARRRSSRSL